MSPAALGRALRGDTRPSMRRRRGVVALSLAAAASMAAISLYQLGIVRSLPEPRSRWFDLKRVDGSAQAYSYFSMPDAVLGFGSYAATMALAAMGSPARARTRPWLAIATGAKVLFDAAQAAKLSVDQWTKHRAFCAYCLAAAAATVAMVPLALPEAGEALRGLRRR